MTAPFIPIDTMTRVEGPVRFLYHGWAVRWSCPDCRTLNQWVDGSPNSDPIVELPRRVTCKSCRSHFALHATPPKAPPKQKARPRHGGFMHIDEMP